jgi:hypothetical protein
MFIPKRENISKNTNRAMRMFLLMVIPLVPISSLGEAGPDGVSILYTIIKYFIACSFAFDEKFISL